MYTNFSELIRATISDAAITTHLFHHRSRPTVAHILAGLNQLRCRGRSEGVNQLLAQARDWAAPLNLAPADPLTVAAALAPVLVAPFEAIALPNPIKRLRPTQATLIHLAQAFADFPVAPAFFYVVETGLHRDTVRLAISDLSNADIVQIERIRGQKFVIASAYLEFVTALVASNVAQTSMARVKIWSSAHRQTSNQDSPFDRFYDPFFFRSNPPKNQ